MVIEEIDLFVESVEDVGFVHGHDDMIDLPDDKLDLHKTTTRTVSTFYSWPWRRSEVKLNIDQKHGAWDCGASKALLEEEAGCQRN